MNGKCVECGSNRIASITAECPDGAVINIGGREYSGDIPDDLNIGGGTTLELEFCCQCGMILADFPLDETSIEAEEEPDRDD